MGGKMRQFKHLSRTKRLQLESLLKANVHKREIAKILDVHISTIYREIKRGECTQKRLISYTSRGVRKYKSYKTYSCDFAQANYEKLQREKSPGIKMRNDFYFAEYVYHKIVEERYSPQAVIGEIKAQNLEFDTKICVNTLYNYISKGVFSKIKIKHLPIKSKKKKKKRSVTVKRAPSGTSIEKRPLEIYQRKTFGHWEMDCVCGSTRHTLLVLTERLTRKEIIIPMKNRKSESVLDCLNKIERQYGAKFKTIFKSITVDNGSEFADSKALETSILDGSMRTKVYYCHPYCSSERGSNERLNREIRRWIPKGVNLSKYTSDEIQSIENWVNNYPRKIFNFKSSSEIFNNYVA